MFNRETSRMLVSLIIFQLFCALEIDALIYRNENIRIGDFKKVHKGRALNNHAIKTMHVSSKIDCVLGCLGVEQCVSYNYQETSSTGNHICEFNNSTSSLSRLEEFKARDGFSYGESVLQTSNKGFCASFPCKNNGMCILVDNVNECACQKTTTGDLCEQWTDDAENYTLIFPYKSTNDFISAVALNSTEVSTLSICVWVSYIGVGWNTFFSYSTSSTATMLAMRCHETGKCEIIINSVPSEVYTAPLNDGSWHHVCFSWTNNQGLLKFYVDGAVRTSKKAIGSSLVIDGNGKLFLGQLQTSSTELSFNPSESFMGKMYGFNMWDAVKSPSEFLSLSKQCISGPGNLVDWRVFIVKESNGMINKAKPSICAFNVSKTANIQSSNGEKYIKMPFTASLREVTVCFWARRQSASTSSAFCYYSDTLGHALRWTFYETTEHKVYAANVQTLVYSSPNYDNLWHHFCYTWDNTDGRLVVFIDGVVMTNISAVATGETIEGSGTLVVGQRQTQRSAAVSAESYWRGYLTDFNIWNITLSGHVITAMSKAAARDLGNVLNWNDVIYGGEVMGSLSLTPTSDVTTKVTDSDFYLNFGSTGSVSNYVEFQNPIPSITEFLVCFWMWPTSSHGGVFAYSIPSLADEWGAYIHPNKAEFVINNHWNYTSTVTPSFTDGWSHFCWRWKNSDGTTEFYKDGQLMKSLTGYQTGHTIPGGGYFVLGHELDSHKGGFQASQALTGQLSHLNVWDKFSLVSQSMEEMSRGASAFQGNVVPWMSLRNKIYGTITVVESSSCTLPDFSTKELRYKWCTDNINPGSSCPVLYPLFDRTVANNGKRLRCYCKNYLVKNSAGHYIYNAANAAYFTRNSLRLIKNA